MVPSPLVRINQIPEYNPDYDHWTNPDMDPPEPWYNFNICAGYREMDTPEPRYNFNICTGYREMDPPELRYNFNICAGYREMDPPEPWYIICPWAGNPC